MFRAERIPASRNIHIEGRGNSAERAGWRNLKDRGTKKKKVLTESVMFVMVWKEMSRRV